MTDEADNRYRKERVMAAHNVYAGEAHFQMGRGRGMSFKPKGPVRQWDAGGDELDARDQENPTVSRHKGSGLAARFFVGLKVKDEVKWKEDDVIEIVVRVREQQESPPDASILTQRGIYRDSSGSIVDEPSLQVIIIDMTGLPKTDFVDEMIELGEALQDELEQEMVILEIQKRGVVIDSYWITP
jgi:hypothetical protein